jgi:hypothetical protein
MGSETVNGWDYRQKRENVPKSSCVNEQRIGRRQISIVPLTIAMEDEDVAESVSPRD